jgi:hypothetical protein
MSKFPVALLLVLGSAFVPRPAFAGAKRPAGNAPIFEEDLRAGKIQYRGLFAGSYNNNTL